MASNREFDLTDILTAVYRNRYIFTAVFIAVFSVIAITAIVSTHVYSYTTILQIGGTPVQSGSGANADDFHFIESPEALQAKLTNNFIPESLEAYKAKSSSDKARYSISVSIPNKSGIVILGMDTSKSNAAAANWLLTSVSNRLIEDDKKLFAVIMDGFQDDMREAQQQLSDLNAQLKQKNEEIHNLAQVTNRAAQEASRLGNYIKNASQELLKTNEDSAGKLLIKNQIASARFRLGNLNDQLNFAIPSHRIQLQNDAMTLENKIWQQKIAISQLNTELKLAKPTLLVRSTARSLYPVGVGKMTRILLGLILAFAAALIAVYVSVLSKMIRQRIADEKLLSR